MISFGKDGLILFQSKENKISNILNHKKIINKAKQKILTLCREEIITRLYRLSIIKLEQRFNGTYNFL